MVSINKTLVIKYKLAQSVFETLNAAAYSTQARPLGTTTRATNTILSHETFCDTILPILIGNNNKNQDWERDKKDYVASIQLSIPVKGYNLNLGVKFNLNDTRFKEAIDSYIEANKLYKVTPAIPAVAAVAAVEEEKDANGRVIRAAKAAIAAKDGVPEKRELFDEKEIAEHIFKNVEPIEYHRYFSFVETAHYLYWILAIYSSQVANKVEDIDKSPNIRFFLYDEKIAHSTAMDQIALQNKAVNKLSSIKQSDTNYSLIKSIVLIKNIVTYEALEDMDGETAYLELFRFANNSPAEFLAIAEDKDIAIQLKIRNYIETGILRITDVGNIVESKNENSVIGNNLSSAVSYFKNPLHEGEVNRFELEFKQLKR